jgi:uncharacterized protein YlxW (UPF0749 family)
MKIDESKILILLSSVILGYLIASQISFGNFSPSKIVTLKDYQQKTAEIRRTTDEINLLREQRNALSLDISKYKTSGESIDQEINNLGDQLINMDLYAGNVPVSGPGVQITLSDRKNVTDTDKREDPFLGYLVHDEDVLFLIWELKAAGAEAISVNGERIISKTAITCGGPIIYINGEEYTPPFVIKAIGDPDKLEAALNNDDSVYRSLLDRQLDASFTREKELKISKYSGNSTLSSAKPYKGQ